MFFSPKNSSCNQFFYIFVIVMSAQHISIPMILRIWLLAMFHLACSILNAQTAHIEHILNKQLQLCDSLERAGDSIAAYHQLTRYNRMYDSLVQVVAEHTTTTWRP